MRRKITVIAALIAILSLLMFTGCGSSGTDMTLHFSFGDRTGTYDGEVNEEGLPDGQGTFTTQNDAGEKWTYTGEFSDGHFEGEGEISWVNGQKETGTYHEDELMPEPAGEIPAMYGNPDEYRYHCFEITGQVFNVIGYSDGELQFQMYEDIENNGNNTLVMFTGENPELNDGDYVRVKGIIQGAEDYENLFGGTVSSVVMGASEVKVTDYKDAAAPTLREVEVKESETQYGYKVSIEKVEFAAKETRVYVRVENEGSSVLSVYSFDAIASQGGKQYKYESNWEADYPEIQTELRTGNSTEGILVFKGLKQEDFKVILSAYSDNWEEELKDFEIDVRID